MCWHLLFLWSTQIKTILEISQYSNSELFWSLAPNMLVKSFMSLRCLSAWIPCSFCDVTQSVQVKARMVPSEWAWQPPFVHFPTQHYKPCRLNSEITYPKDSVTHHSLCLLPHNLSLTFPQEWIASWHFPKTSHKPSYTNVSTHSSYRFVHLTSYGPSIKTFPTATYL
jgi:hypothetical protein